MSVRYRVVIKDMSTPSRADAHGTDSATSDSSSKSLGVTRLGLTQFRPRYDELRPSSLLGFPHHVTDCNARLANFLGGQRRVHQKHDAGCT